MPCRNLLVPSLDRLVESLWSLLSANHKSLAQQTKTHVSDHVLVHTESTRHVIRSDTSQSTL